MSEGGGNVITADFLAVTEETTGKDLDGLFGSWLFADGQAPWSGVCSLAVAG